MNSRELADFAAFKNKRSLQRQKVAMKPREDFVATYVAVYVFVMALSVVAVIVLAADAVLHHLKAWGR